MSTISASTTTTTAYVVTADTTGALVLQTGATPTTALTLSSAQKMTLPNDASISGLTVGKGGGALTTNTALGAGSLALNSSGAYNTAVGAQAGSSLSSGATSTFVGQGAGQSSTTSSDNTALGAAALNSNTTGASNTAIGRQALQLNTTASNNTAVGYQAGYNYNGSYNTAQGFQAMYGSGTVANNTGSNNTGIGNSALFSLSTGSDNQAFGTTALYLNTTGSSNTAVGRDALRSNTTASNNTAVGYQAGYSNTAYSFHTYVGYQAGYSNVNGVYNTFIGYQAGYNSNPTVANVNSLNTFVGYYTGQGVTTGASNSFFGTSAGYQVTTGSKNTILGSYNGNQGSLDIRTASNYIVLSDGDGNPRQIINNSGNVYVGTYPPKYSTGSGMFTVSQLTNAWDTAVFGNMFVDCQTAYNSDPKPGIVFGIPYTSTASATGVSIQAYKMTASTGDFGQGFRITTQANGSAPSYKMTIDGSGNIGAPSGTNIYNASDVRLKKNIQTLDNALDKINALRGVEFNWIDNFCEAENNKTLYGFIAQEVESVDANLTDPFGPTEIKVDDLTVDNPIRVNEKFIVPLLVNAIKELKAELDTVKAELAALRG